VAGQENAVRAEGPHGPNPVGGYIGHEHVRMYPIGGIDAIDVA
jgi:hypothetical protein